MCGHPHPSHLLQTVTPTQVTEARAYFCREPFGDRETHHLLTTLIVIAANAFRKKGSPAIKHSDVMPNYPLPSAVAADATGQSVYDWLIATGRTTTEGET